MSKIAVLIAIVASVGFAGCGRGPDSTATASCARVVRQIRDLPGPVEVVGSVETAEGQVEIDYESADGESGTVTGSASCTFAVGGPGSLQLVEAIVDGAALDADEIAAANRALSGQRP